MMCSKDIDKKYVKMRLYFPAHGMLIQKWLQRILNAFAIVTRYLR